MFRSKRKGLPADQSGSCVGRYYAVGKEWGLNPQPGRFQGSDRRIRRLGTYETKGHRSNPVGRSAR